MKLWFILSEGFKGLARARLAALITITSIAFALLLLGGIVLFSTNIAHLVEKFKKNIELEVFLDADLNAAESQKIENRIRTIAGVDKTKLITKDKAAQRFKAEFGRDVYEVLGGNPLPASCTITIKETHITADKLKKISNEVSRISGVSEALYRADIIQLIEKYLRYIYLIGGSVAFVLILITVVLIYNTIRLTIAARKSTIKIMQLAGATPLFIRIPFIVEGVLQGMIGAVVSCGLIYFVSRLAEYFLTLNMILSKDVFLTILISGVLLGFFSSLLSVSKHMNTV
jgi:cell division transport system permease protein